MGAEGPGILADFFHAQLKKFLQPDLTPLGREIIECCMEGGTVEDYAALIKVAND